MTYRLLLLVALLAPAWLHAETPVALDASDERAIQLGLRALKMTERDLAFQKTNVEAEFIMPVARAFLQQPLALPAFGQSVFSPTDQKLRLGDYRVQPGETLRFRYRVIIHPGSVKDADIEGLFYKYADKP